MKTQFSNILVAMGLLLVTISCNNESAPEMSVDYSLSKEASIEKLPSDIEDLSLSDAETVANLFNKKSATRSQQEKTIKNVIAINGKDGNTAIYAVNFNEDGYILVSATTKYYPILATVDHGEYSDDMPETGQQIVIAGMLDNIELIKSGKTKIDCIGFWSPFKESAKKYKKTRTSDPRYNDYLCALDEFTEWVNEQDDANYYKLVDCRNILPSRVYSEFVRAAQSEDLWEGTDFSWENTAYVYEKIYEDEYHEGPFLTTSWNQEGSYNTSGYPTLGCVTIAVGQLMRFYMRPSNIEWEKMPSSGATSTLTEFLKKLRTELKVDAEGGSYINDAERVLKSYGYNVSKMDHNENKAYSQLYNNKKPIYSQGDSGKAAHAWVTDGAQVKSITIRYVLYRLSDTAYPEFEYVAAENADPFDKYGDACYYHMNWGWGGNRDGWFMDGNIAIPGMDNSYNFRYNRKDLFINN